MDSNGHLLCSPHRPCEPTTPNNLTSPLTSDTSEAYTDWNSDKYSGCFKCHAAVANGQVALTNDQLAETHPKMTEWAAIGYTAIVATTIAVGSVALGPDIVQPALRAIVSMR
jgi:hypothetical protein